MILLSGFAYRSQERLNSFLFPDQCHRSNCMCVCLHSRIIVKTEEYNCTVRNRCTQRGSGCDPVSRGHGNIHEHDIGMKRLCQRNCLAAIARFPNHRDIWRPFEP